MRHRAQCAKRGDRARERAWKGGAAVTSSRVDSEFVAVVGQNVRRLRKERGLTVQKLAELADVSRRMLTHIELGQANPSLITVDKIARALSTDFTGLLVTAEPEALEVVAADQAQRVWSSNDGSEALLHVSARERGGPELWSWKLSPGDRYEALPDPAGSEEFFYVVKGELTIETQDAGTAVLAVGAAARLATDRDYTYVNDGDEECWFVRVVRVRELTMDEQERS